MIEISNSVPVFDENNNVIKFKYNDGLIIHDCLTNTLNVSYLIVKDLMGQNMTIEDVLLELKQHFTLFSDIKCHDRDFLIDLIKGLVVDEYNYDDRMFWDTNDGHNVLEYSKMNKVVWVSNQKIWYVLIIEYGYHYHQLSKLCTLVLSEYFNLDIFISHSSDDED